MATKKTDPIYVSVQSYFTPGPSGHAQFIEEGSRSRESSGFPKKHPDFWLQDGATDGEIAQAKFRLFEQSEANRSRVEPSTRVGPRMVRALRSFVDGPGQPIVAGELYAESHEAVALAPEAFEPCD